MLEALRSIAAAVLPVELVRSRAFLAIAAAVLVVVALAFLRVLPRYL